MDKASGILTKITGDWASRHGIKAESDRSDIQYPQDDDPGHHQGDTAIVLSGQLLLQEQAAPQYGGDAVGGDDGGRESHVLRVGQSTESPEELWRTCTPFSRESCRAAADFIPAYCKMAGISPEDAAAGHWDLSAELLENMARTEHLRWNAFHRSMGWRVMSDEEFDRRAALYLAQKSGRPTIRIAKNDAEKHHACLVSWEELAVLSDKENAVTGGTVDYQQYDRNNILAVPSLLSAIEKRS